MSIESLFRRECGYTRDLTNTQNNKLTDFGSRLFPKSPTLNVSCTLFHSESTPLYGSSKLYEENNYDA